MDGWEVVPVDGIEVRYRLGPWKLVASWPQRGGRHDVVSLIRIREQTATGERLVLSTKRINLLSSSAVGALISALAKNGDRALATEFVHEVCEDLLGWYRQAAETTTPDPSRPVKARRWLTYPIWPANGTTAVAGAPDGFKSLIAEAIALQVASGTVVLANNTRVERPRKVLYLDWESDEDAFTERLRALCTGAGLELKPWMGYKRLSAPLSHMALALSEEIAKRHYEAVVVDSMSASIGGGMIDDDTVNAFWDSARTLGVPTLILAHKSAKNTARRRARFFGSTMSEVRVRLAWNVERASNKGQQVVWEAFKDNHTGRHGMKLAWRLDIGTDGKDEHERLDTITIEAINPDHVTLTTADGDTLADTITRVLEHGPMTLGDLAEALHKKPDTVRAQLHRHKRRFAKHTDGRRWRLAGQQEPPE